MIIVLKSTVTITESHLFEKRIRDIPVQIKIILNKNDFQSLESFNTSLLRYYLVRGNLVLLIERSLKVPRYN